MVRTVQRFLQNQSGATAIEYGLIALGIAVVIVVAVDQTGINLRDGVYTDMANLF